MSTQLRRLTFGAAAALLIVLGGAPLLPVNATQQQPMTVSAKESPTQSYPPMIGPDLQDTGGALAVDPSDCFQVPFCDAIPVTVEVPEGVGEEDNVAVTFEVSWDDPSASNDIDVFAFDNQQIAGSTYSQVAKSQTSSNPERIRVNRAILGDYWLMVRNMNGVNTGYTVKAKLTTEKFTSPIELLEPPPAVAETTTTTVAEAAPVDLSGTPEEAPTTDVTLAPVEAAPDTGLDFGPSEFDNQLKHEIPIADGEAIAAAQKLLASKQGTEPGWKVATWFLGAPLALVGGSFGFLLWRRRGAGVL